MEPEEEEEDRIEREVEEILSYFATRWKNPAGYMALNGALPALFRAHTPSLGDMCNWQNEKGAEQLAKAQNLAFELLYNGVELQLHVLLSMGVEKGEIISVVEDFVETFNVSQNAPAFWSRSNIFKR